MDFENDAFISYAHLDNQPLVEGQAGWVADFHRALAIRVGQFLGKEPHIWRDPKLDGNDYFAESLIDRLRRVAVLIPVLSPRYVKSEWTRRELAEFCKAATQENLVRIGEKSRLFKVLKTPVPREQHPPELQPLLGYEFFSTDPESGKIRPWDQVFGAESQRDFWMKLDDLANDLCELLKLIEPEALTIPEGPPKPCVYLAETTADLKTEYEGIRRDLQEHGYRVLPADSLPVVASELTEVVENDLAQCQLSIHLVGKHYSLVPEGAKQSLLELQSQLAAKRFGSGGFRSLTWIPPNLTIDDDRQREFVARLRMQPTEGGDLLERPFEELKTLIQTRLNAPEKEPRKSTDLKQLYLICDSRDNDAILPWQKYLFSKGLEVISPLFEGSESEIREYHDENLRVCDGVLIYFGCANEAWLRRKLREVQKSLGYGRTEPVSALGVLIAPPQCPQKERFQTHEAIVISQLGGFSPDALIPFIDQMCGQGAGAG